ncbi:hypothetical protein U4I41_12770 [Stenotrophomonas maltophilia]|uniref:hypothetical protein n=1 Tax=Stenotrophomonas maltophilia TaxID=40324 RepID=UPI0018D2B751|nr:hypothetical protein [Stenotrophomonas maltophilia]MBH1655824.1 hypothetical protein [Stenotrophomonas maltophilia]MBH1844204.1 hypothetical protein [Stenotrophomonas maltophilia]MDZ5833230.1 hypothetical protein [Stenotrophomonas maltophilia]
MKRIGILLVVLVALAWIGSKVVPRSEPAAAKAPAAVAETRQKQAQESEAPKSEPERPMTAMEKKAQQEKWFGAETIVAAERAVRGELKDPDAAHFRDVRANYTEEFGMVACGRVNAKNDFGGYTGFRRFVSGGKSVILEGRDNVADAWAGACL